MTAPAGAVVTTLGGTTVGLQPREASRYWEGEVKLNGLGKKEYEVNTAIGSFGNPHGHEVMHSVRTYAIYWDPDDYYHGDWQGLIDGFLANIGNAGRQDASVFAVDGQYTDTTDVPAATSSTFHGAYVDTYPYPETGNCVDPHKLEFNIPLLENGETVCLTDAQVRAELQRFIKQRETEHYDLPKGMGTIFYLMTPPGVTACLDGGGPDGHCSDFDGTPGEISEYEEAKNIYPEELEKYEKEREAGFPKYEEEKEKYEAEKKEKEENHEKLPVEPKKPIAPTAPVEPTSYPSYEKSFCSYHGFIGSGSTAVLYGMIPWTAGGDGDYHLSSVDETPAFACQDGGFEPSKNPGGELQEKEREKVETLLEKEESAKQDEKEKREHQEAKEKGLAKPHEQEPNQLGTVGPDGSYDTGLADLIINQIAVEQQDIVTDPLLNGWQDSAGNEVTDECRNFFVPTSGGSSAANLLTRAGTLSNQSLGGGNYYLNGTYNLAAARRLHPGREYPGLPYPGVQCLNGISLEPLFTAPNTVKGGEVVGFDGMESNITLNSADSFSANGALQPNYATYTWNFGDGDRGDATPEVSGYAPGSPACEEPWLSTEPPATRKPPGVWVGCTSSAYHTYKYTGTYEVTLTVRDVAGNEAQVKKALTVEGEPWPEEKGSGSSGGGGSGVSPGASTTGSTTGTSTTTSGGGSSPAKPIPGPVASAAVTSRSLSTALKKGLLISYSVNEQVAGQFQVLLASSLAKRVGLHGPPATGLAPGSVPSIVIGKAILVTTKGGRNTVKIQFGKKTAAKLRKLGSVPLTIRLIVRNASSHSPQTTTVISAVTLSR